MLCLRAACPIGKKLLVSWCSFHATKLLAVSEPVCGMVLALVSAASTTNGTTIDSPLLLSEKGTRQALSYPSWHGSTNVVIGMQNAPGNDSPQYSYRRTKQKVQLKVNANADPVNVRILASQRHAVDQRFNILGRLGHFRDAFLFVNPLLDSSAVTGLVEGKHDDLSTAAEHRQGGYV